MTTFKVGVILKPQYNYDEGFFVPTLLSVLKPDSCTKLFRGRPANK